MTIVVPSLKDSQSAKTAKSSRRLFDANDWESTGIVRFWPELLDDQ